MTEALIKAQEPVPERAVNNGTAQNPVLVWLDVALQRRRTRGGSIIPTTTDVEILQLISRLAGITYADGTTISASDQNAFGQAVRDLIAAQRSIPPASVTRALYWLAAWDAGDVDIDLSAGNARVTTVRNTGGGVLRTALNATANGNPTGG